MKRAIILILLIGGIAAGVYYSQHSRSGDIVLTGIVTTDHVIVSPQIQGRLQELKVKQGDLVKKGQLLAVIQPEQWQADMAYYASTQEQVAQQVTRAEADLRFQEEQTKNQIAQAEANLEVAKAEVAQGQADLENARISWEREDQLFKQGAETAQAHDQAKALYDSNRARVDALQKQVHAADAALAMAKSNVEQNAVRRAALDATKQQLAAASAQKEKAQVQLQYTQIRSPIDGIVDVRAAMQGEVVSPGQAIVTLIDQDDLWVRADVEETYIDQIRIGEKLTVRLPSGAAREGTIFYRAVDADYATQRDVSRTKRDIRTFEVRLRCDNSDRALAVGMTAYVVLPVGK
jgi:HlyD family secretion protein